MSLTGEITKLVGKATELIDTFEAKEAEINQEVQAAVAAFPQTHKVFYVDAVNGDSNNSGDQEEPLLTIQDAVERTPINGSANINLLSNVILPPERYSLQNKSIQIYGHRAPGGKAKLKATVFEKDGYAYLSGWNTFGLNAGFMLRFVDIEFPTYTGELPGFNRYRSILGNFSGYVQTLSHFAISDAELIFPNENGFGLLACASGTGLVFLGNSIVDVNGNMSGRYVDGADASNPSNTTQLITNMATL
ncbi:hypothetical protein PsW64_02386 [Pseudovibrio sp. W64]|uniref:hypothetical protein n=1 Tax=Pseudovibrio sp. W64 TaxID=1735583 RepID=UPI0007AE6E92|nr:hypothetical protein [Pseudovibrio sp. W64]KZK81797.1 hypothetical protein PsW64_02386 [Pseudovibrio sp. W64]